MLHTVLTTATYRYLHHGIEVVRGLLTAGQQIDVPNGYELQCLERRQDMDIWMTVINEEFGIAPLHWVDDYIRTGYVLAKTEEESIKNYSGPMSGEYYVKKA